MSKNKLLCGGTWKPDKRTGGHQVRMPDGRLILVSREGKFNVDLTDEGTKKRLKENFKKLSESLGKIMEHSNSNKENEMTDPTYNIKDIYDNLIWKTAWELSEYLNDNAPIGWGNYIPVAESLNKAGLLQQPQNTNGELE